MNSVNEFSKLRCEWGNDLENRELKWEEDIEDRFFPYKFENRIVSSIGNQMLSFTTMSSKIPVITLIIKANIMEKR